MRKKIVIIGLIVLLVGAFIAFTGFSEVRPFVTVNKGELPPGKSISINLEPGLDSTAVTFNTTYPLNVTVRGSNVLKEGALAGSISVLVNGTHPVLIVENNGTSSAEFTVASTSINDLTKLGGLLFVVGALIGFVGLALTIYGLVRKG